MPKRARRGRRQRLQLRILMEQKERIGQLKQKIEFARERLLTAERKVDQQIKEANKAVIAENRRINLLKKSLPPTLRGGLPDSPASPDPNPSFADSPASPDFNPPSIPDSPESPGPFPCFQESPESPDLRPSTAKMISVQLVNLTGSHTGKFSI